MQYLDKVKSKVDSARITFLKLNKLYQIIGKKKVHNLLSVLKLASTGYVN